MDTKHLIVLALQVSLFVTVFSFGLRATVADALFLVRRPGLFAKSLIAMFVVMPLIAVALARLFDFHQTVEISLIALAISPVPPLIPRKLIKAGGHDAYAIALMATMGLLAIAIVPLAVHLLSRTFGVPLAVAPSTIAGIVFKSVLLPLAVGMLVRAVLPAIAERIVNPVAMIGKILLLLAVLPVLWNTLPALWALVGNGTMLAIAVFVVVGIVFGHLLGGPDPSDRVVLALSSASRHPAIAFTVASANFHEQKFGAAIVLYLLIAAILGIPYSVWQRRRAHAVTAGM